MNTKRQFQEDAPPKEQDQEERGALSSVLSGVLSPHCSSPPPLADSPRGEERLREDGRSWQHGRSEAAARAVRDVKQSKVHHHVGHVQGEAGRDVLWLQAELRTGGGERWRGGERLLDGVRKDNHGSLGSPSRGRERKKGREGSR
eukprot:759369-Hanusia_phi.AAC.2